MVYADCHKAAGSSCWLTEPVDGAGVGADPPADGEPPAEDVAAPAFPKYEGLAYRSVAEKPDEASDLQFPPAEAAKPVVVPLLRVA